MMTPTSVVPYMLHTMAVLRHDLLSPRRVVHGIIKWFFLTGRYAVELGAMVYGSVRYRCLVLP